MIIVTPFFKFVGFEFSKCEPVIGRPAGKVKLMRVQFENGVYGLYKVSKRFNEFADVSNESAVKQVALVRGQWYRAALNRGEIVRLQRNKRFTVSPVTIRMKGTDNTQSGILLAKTNDYIILRVGLKQEQHFYRTSWELV